MKHNALTDAYLMINIIKSYTREHGANDLTADFLREKRNVIRRINQHHVDPLAKSMQEDWRHVCNECGDSGYDFCIIPDCGESEDEIREMAECMVGYPPISSPYDCTGLRFTCWIDVKRIPLGFAVIHHWGLDV